MRILEAQLARFRPASRAVCRLMALHRSGCGDGLLDHRTILPRPWRRPRGGSASSITHPRFGDNKPHEWEGGAPWTYAVHGTDVSKYQTSSTGTKAKANRRFLRLHQGDRRRRPGRRLLRRALARPGPPAFRAAPIISTISAARPPSRRAGSSRTCPMSAVPCPRCSTWNGTPSRRPASSGRAPETVRSEMRIFLSIIEKHYGKKPIIYTSVDFFEDNGLSGFGGYPYWLRSVAGHPDRNMAATPSPSGNTPVPALFRASGATPTSMSSTADMAAWKSWLKTHAH